MLKFLRSFNFYIFDNCTYITLLLIITAIVEYVLSNYSWRTTDRKRARFLCGRHDAEEKMQGRRIERKREKEGKTED